MINHLRDIMEYRVQRCPQGVGTIIIIIIMIYWHFIPDSLHRTFVSYILWNCPNKSLHYFISTPLLLHLPRPLSPFSPTPRKSPNFSLKMSLKTPENWFQKFGDNPVIKWFWVWNFSKIVIWVPPPTIRYIRVLRYNKPGRIGSFSLRSGKVRESQGNFLC